MLDTNHALLVVLAITSVGILMATLTVSAVVITTMVTGVNLSEFLG